MAMPGRDDVGTARPGIKNTRPPHPTRPWKCVFHTIPLPGQGCPYLDTSAPGKTPPAHYLDPRQVLFSTTPDHEDTCRPGCLRLRDGRPSLHRVSQGSPH